MRKYTSEKRSESRTVYQFEELNSKGEKITFELTKCKSDGSKGTMPYLWKKHKFIDQILKSWWSVDVCVTDSEGYSWIRYNPQIKPYQEIDSKGNVVQNRNVINFEWMLEATEENRDKIIAEIEKRAFA